ncbi:hypothetical protein ACFV5G_05835, partial [Streptomyces sp. NPDC059766]
MVKVAEVKAEEIDEDVGGTAHLLQRRVGKVADARVTVIGSRTFWVRIDSGLLDWRTTYGRLYATPVEPPRGIVPRHEFLRGGSFRYVAGRHRARGLPSWTTMLADSKSVTGTRHWSPRTDIGQQMSTTSKGTTVRPCSIARRLEGVGRGALCEVINDRGVPAAAQRW